MDKRQHSKKMSLGSEFMKGKKKIERQKQQRRGRKKKKEERPAPSWDLKEISLPEFHSKECEKKECWLLSASIAQRVREKKHSVQRLPGGEKPLEGIHKVRLLLRERKQSSEEKRQGEQCKVTSSKLDGLGVSAISRL